MLRCFRRGESLNALSRVYGPALFVTLRGPFVFTGPPQSGKSVKFDRAYAIFDPSSGNLLMAGTLDAADQQPR
jgi:hypothetical protein